MVISLLSIAALLGLGTVLTHWRARTRETVALAAYPPEGQLLEVNGSTMHAITRGEGIDVVLIHGSSGSVRDYTFALLPELARRYRVTAIDRPGMGWSSEIDDSTELPVQAKQILATTTQLGIEKPIVVGQSYGGAVALSWAVNFPDDIAALVTVSAPSRPWTTGLGTYYSILSHPLGQLFAVPLLCAFISPRKVKSEIEGVFRPQTAPKGYSDHFGPGMTLRRAALRSNALHRHALLSEIELLCQDYGNIDIPTEIIHGTADPTVTANPHADYLAQKIPHAHLTLLEGVGHMPHHVAIDNVLAAVERAALRAGLK